MRLGSEDYVTDGGASVEVRIATVSPCRGITWYQIR